MVRKIFVDDISEIDFANFGVHFSADNNYSHNAGGSNGSTPNGRYEVSAWVRRGKVNEAATSLSNEEYPSEKEVVLEFGQTVTAEVGIFDTAEKKAVSFEKMKINTGTRCDEWVKTI